MRQGGILAAARLMAIKVSSPRSHIDYENARFLAEGMAEIPGVKSYPKKVKTNILYFDV